MTENKLIDIDRLMKEFSGDEEILAEISSVFEAELPKMLAAIEIAIRSGDMKSLERTAHTLKGAVSNFQSPRVKDAAFALEKQGRENQKDDVNESFIRLKELLNRLLDELHILLKKAS
jgi:two-component system sensor histidine kinase/response regulator